MRRAAFTLGVFVSIAFGVVYAIATRPIIVGVVAIALVAWLALSTS